MEYRGYTIEVKQFRKGEREWSEDAVEYRVDELGIVDECEGEENVLEYASKDIDNKLN